jgi:hypothetical protein
MQTASSRFIVSSHSFLASCFLRRLPAHCCRPSGWPCLGGMHEAVDGQCAVSGEARDHNVDLVLIGSCEDIAMREVLGLPPNTQVPARFD